MKIERVKCYIPTCIWWDYPAGENKLGVKNETNKNIDDEVNEDKLYEIDKTSLDDK